MNLKIAIVEDEEVQLTYVKKLLTKWSLNTNNKIQLTTCMSAEEFEFKYLETMDFDLIFLDIVLNKTNGMELAKQIRKKDKVIQIAFLTGMKDYVFEGYEIGAIRYLLKPVKEDVLYQLLDECLEKSLQTANDYFIFQYQGETIRLSYSQIILLQIDGHYLNMKVTDRTFEWKGSLSKAYEMLDQKRFILVNRSTIVNLSYVVKITREQCYIEDGQVIDVSRNSYHKLNRAFINFYM